MIFVRAFAVIYKYYVNANKEQFLKNEFIRKNVSYKLFPTQQV